MNEKKVLIPYTAYASAYNIMCHPLNEANMWTSCWWFASHYF